MAPRRAAPASPARRRSQRIGRPSKARRDMTCRSNTQSSATLQMPSSQDQDAQPRDHPVVIPETPLAMPSPSDEFVTLRGQREEARRLRVDAEMAAMRKEIKANLAIVRAGAPTALSTAPALAAANQQALRAEKDTNRFFLSIHIQYPMINETTFVKSRRINLIPSTYPNSTRM